MAPHCGFPQRWLSYTGDIKAKILKQGLVTFLIHGYINSLASIGAFLIVRRGYPSCFNALEHVLSICADHDKSSVNVTPRSNCRIYIVEFWLNMIHSRNMSQLLALLFLWRTKQCYFLFELMFIFQFSHQVPKEAYKLSSRL